MKKFVLMTIGFIPPTEEIMAQWMEWFESLQDIMVDQVGLYNGRDVVGDDVVELDMGKDAITGYLVINAKGMDEAVAIAKRCPAVTSTKVYEVMSHEG